MTKTILQSALEAAASRMLVTGIHNGTESITQWVEENILKENPNVSTNKKIAFYEAEKALIEKYISEVNYEKLTTLVNAIDNEKFDQEFKNYPNYSKLKANECIVLASAIIKSQKFLREDNTMHQALGNLLNTKYEALKSIEYDISKLTIIDTALQIVHFEGSNDTNDITLTGEA